MGRVGPLHAVSDSESLDPLWARRPAMGPHTPDRTMRPPTCSTPEQRENMYRMPDRSMQSPTPVYMCMPEPDRSMQSPTTDYVWHHEASDRSRHTGEVPPARRVGANTRPVGNCACICDAVYRYRSAMSPIPFSQIGPLNAVSNLVAPILLPTPQMLSFARPRTELQTAALAMSKGTWSGNLATHQRGRD